MTHQYVSILDYSDNIFTILNEEDKAQLGLFVVPYYNYTKPTVSTWIAKQPSNVSARDWLLTRLRNAKRFSLRPNLYVDPLGKYVWFTIDPNRIEEYLAIEMETPEPSCPASPPPLPWFKTPNGKRYLDEWRNGRLQHGAYVFADAGTTVRLLDPTKPQPGDPIPGDVLCYIHSPCALMVQVDPGLLRAPSGIADIVAAG